MATHFKTQSFASPPQAVPATDLRTLHRMALSEMARFQEEMERLEIPAEAVDKIRDAVLIAVEDFRRRYPTDEILPMPLMKAAEHEDVLDCPPPARSPAMRRFLGF